MRWKHRVASPEDCVKGKGSYIRDKEHRTGSHLNIIVWWLDFSGRVYPKNFLNITEYSVYENTHDEMVERLDNGEVGAHI